MSLKDFIAIIVLIVATPGRAVGADILKLQEFTFNYKRFADNNHAPYFADNARQKDAVAFNAQADIGPYLFWNQEVHGESDPGQFHSIGYHFWLGARVTQNIDLQYEHHSQHLLDSSRTDHFPVEDSVGVTLYLFKADKNRNALWR